MMFLCNYNYVDIYSSIINGDMSIFPDTAKDNKGITMMTRTAKVENSFISFLRVN